MIRASSTLLIKPSMARHLSISSRAVTNLRVQELNGKVDRFVADAHEHLPSDGDGVALASAWIATDNVIAHLMANHTPEIWNGTSLVAVDTLHLFDETHEVAQEVQDLYGKPAHIRRPLNCDNRDDFNKLYGHCEEIDHADFDFHSKVEPFTRALSEVGRKILITGRREDQGEAREQVALFQPENKIFNPLATWSWDDVIDFAESNGVPLNRAHNYVFRANDWVCPLRRHRGTEVAGAEEKRADDVPWTRVDLGKPSWHFDSAELRDGHEEAYVYKSFGDIHSTVPVYPHESERTGRFVRVVNTECGIHTRAAGKGAPHGGTLVNLIDDEATSQDVQNLKNKAGANRIELSERQACDVELLLNGGFSPLTGFMDENTYTSVVETMRLPEQQLFGLPVTLDVHSNSQQGQFREGDHVLLTYEGQDLAVLNVESKFSPDKTVEAVSTFGTSSLEHPGVHELAVEKGDVYLGGTIEGIALPERVWQHRTPRQVRDELDEKFSSEGADDTAVIAFQNRNPIHRAHYELIRRAPGAVKKSEGIKNAVVLVHPTVGPTQPGDIDGDTRIHTYEVLKDEVQNEELIWSYLPYSMKMAGPREAIQHMIIRKNFGATHFIIGRDMAGTKSTVTGKDFYGPYDAQTLAEEHAKELHMELVQFENMVYTEEEGFLQASEAKEAGLQPKNLSGTKFRELLRSGEDIPEWFAFKSVVDVLRDDLEDSDGEDELLAAHA